MVLSLYSLHFSFSLIFPALSAGLYQCLGCLNKVLIIVPKISSIRGKLKHKQDLGSIVRCNQMDW